MATNLFTKGGGSTPRGTIRRKFTFVISFVMVVILLVCLGSIYIGESIPLGRPTKEGRLAAAKQLSNAISQRVDDTVEYLKGRLSSPVWQEAVTDGNRLYDRMSDDAIISHIIGIDKEWSGASANSPIIARYMNNQIGKELKKMFKEREGIREIYLTDRFGAIVAASHKTDDFYHGDETWWQKAFNNGAGRIVIGPVHYDEAARMMTAPFALPLKDKNGKVIGVCKTEVNMERLLRPLEGSSAGVTGRALLIDKDGNILFHHNALFLNSKFAGDEDLRGILGKDSGWIQSDTDKHHSRNITIAFAGVTNGYLSANHIQWKVLLEQGGDGETARLPYKLVLTAVIIGAILIALILPLRSIVDRLFVKPVYMLKDAIKHISSGDLDYRVEIRTKDEMEELGASFNKMAEELKRSLAEQKELTAKAEQAVSAEKKKSEELSQSLAKQKELILKAEEAAAAEKKKSEELSASLTKQKELIDKAQQAAETEKKKSEELGQSLAKQKELILKAEEAAAAEKKKSEESIGSLAKQKELIDKAQQAAETEKKKSEELGQSLAKQKELILKAEEAAAAEKKKSEELSASLTKQKELTDKIQQAVDAERKKYEELSQTVVKQKELTASAQRSADAERKKSEELTQKLQELQKVKDGAASRGNKEVEESRKALEKANAELKRAKEEIMSLSKAREEKAKAPSRDLSTFYEIAGVISSAADRETLLKLVMESLLKIVDYDICASIFLDAHTAAITLKEAYPESAGFREEAKKHLTDSVSTAAGADMKKKRLNVSLIPPSTDAKPRKEKGADKLSSFYDVPFVIRGKTVGMMMVSSSRASAFTDEDTKLIQTVAEQLVTAVERLEAASTSEKLRMEAMVENMVEGVIMTDERGEIEVFNPQARRMLGFGPYGKVTGRAFNEKLKALGLHEGIEESRSKMRLTTKEITVQQGDEKAVLRCDISPIRNTKGTVTGIVAVLRDITVEKEKDKPKPPPAPAVAPREPKPAMNAMKEFTAIVSNEIPANLTKEEKEQADVIKGNIQRVDQLINNLSDISRIDSGKIELKKTLLNVADLATSVISSIKSEADTKHIELVTLFHKPLSPLYADAGRISQIFDSLIRNAVKFTPENGKVTIEIKETEKELRCSVTDTGRGIAPEDFNKLFNKPQQSDRPVGMGAKGATLGLAMTKELVQKHNGRIWAESKVGVGSKFTFTLPKTGAEGAVKKEDTKA